MIEIILSAWKQKEITCYSKALQVYHLKSCCPVSNVIQIMKQQILLYENSSACQLKTMKIYSTQ